MLTLSTKLAAFISKDHKRLKISQPAAFVVLSGSAMFATSRQIKQKPPTHSSASTAREESSSYVGAERVWTSWSKHGRGEQTAAKAATSHEYRVIRRKASLLRTRNPSAPQARWARITDNTGKINARKPP